MPIVKGYIDPSWHEKNLMVLALAKGSMRKCELFDEVRKEQKKRVVLGGEGITHSISAYNYWLKALEDQQIIHDNGSTLELTSLGKQITY